MAAPRAGQAGRPAGSRQRCGLVAAILLALAGPGGERWAAVAPSGSGLWRGAGSGSWLFCRGPAPAARAAGRRLRGGLPLRRASGGLAGEQPRDGEEDDEGGLEAAAGDWREFRARLVQLEQQEGAGAGEGAPSASAEGWAYESPLIEQGAVLLSVPSNHFAINQQYFHKNVIILISHSPIFTTGIILNRPTALSMRDLPRASGAGEAIDGIDDWNVWFGGDCQGLNDNTGGAGSEKYFVLHCLDRFAGKSETIISGMYSMQFEDAKALVTSGEADKDDFLLLVGYCGWGEGQLQRELDAGDTWTMAAVDQRAVLGELREAQSALRTRIQGAKEGQRFTASDVGDGLEMWERLYGQLGPAFAERLAEFKATRESAHTDEVLRRWITRCLIPSRYNTGTPTTSEARAALRPSTLNLLESGTLLRASATQWLLGKPAEHAKFDLNSFLPGQYFHKAVLVLVRDEDQGVEMVALLNGPVLSRGSQGTVLWGGPGGNVELKVDVGEESILVKGLTVLLPGTLDLLLNLGAFEKVVAADLDTVLRAPAEDRWALAGGRIRTVADAEAAQLGDEQRRLWFRRFLGIEVA